MVANDTTSIGPSALLESGRRSLIIAPMAPTPPQASSEDPLKLTELFQGGGEPWLPLLRPVIEGLPKASTFVGPARDKRIVPVRELTFQALKPNPPEKWK